MKRKVLGLVLEINPFHTGHKYFIDKAIELTKPDLVVAIISSSFSMRGDISVMDKFTKTKLLLENNIDIVLELPFLGSNASADYFGLNAIKALSKFNITDFACGVELDDLERLEYLSNLTNSSDFNNLVKNYLDQGLSYSGSYNKALLDYEIDEELITNYSLPNNTLAISYINAFKKLNINPKITLIKRIENNYYDLELKETFSSSTSLRLNLDNNKDLALKYLIDKEYNYLNSHDLLNKIFLLIKERFIVFGSSYMTKYLGIEEGIENRIASSLDKATSYEELISLIVTKRYTQNRIKRALLNILFCIEKKDLKSNEIDYLRVLGFTNNGSNYINKLDKNIKKEIITSLKNRDDYVSQIELKVTKMIGLLTNNNDFYLNEFLIPIKIKETE